MTNDTDSVRSGRAAEALGSYSHARRAGGLLFLAGLGPRRRGKADIPGATLAPDGSLIDYDIEAELRACMDNVREVLTDAGSSWDKIVDVTAFLTNLQRDWATYNRVYAEFFPANLPQPTRTTVEIRALPTGGKSPIHVELKVIALA